MRLPRLKAIAGFFLAAILSAPAWGSETSANSALPGTLNYVEGQALIGAQVLNSESVGSAELQPGQSLTTQAASIPDPGWPAHPAASEDLAAGFMAVVAYFMEAGGGFHGGSGGGGFHGR